MPASRALVLAAFALLGVSLDVGCKRPPSSAQPDPPSQPMCTGNANCGPDRVCDAGACRPCAAGECVSCPDVVECASDADCPANTTCAAPPETPGRCKTCRRPDPSVTPPGPITTPPPADPPASDPKALLLAMEDAYSKVRDYTVTLVRRERVKGKLLPQETMQVKFRKPYSTYIRWTGNVYKGREALYIRGKNGSKLRAHQGSFPDVTVDLDPRGSLAMKGNRHPITEGSLGDLIGLLTRDLKRAETRPQDGAIIQDLGESERHGHKIRCFDATFAVADGYYAPHVQICMFTATSLPSRVQVWDAREQLLEDYEYRDLKTNVGLRDLDFDSTNPKYNF